MNCPKLGKNYDTNNRNVYTFEILKKIMRGFVKNIFMSFMIL